MKSPYLEVTEATGKRIVPIEGGPLTIGRNFTNLVAIEEPMASRFHCVIERQADGVSVRDLDSRNGTRVNGKPIKAVMLKEGDVVSIGKTEMRFILKDAPAKVGAKGIAARTGPGGAIAKPKPQPAPEPDAMEELVDLVNEDDQPDSQEEAPATAVPAGTSEYERILRDRAESLVDRTFTENDIVLINVRGAVAHPAIAAGSRDASEAVTLLRLILLICFRSRATDIHVEPKNEDAHIRIRVDGTMVDVVRVSKELGVKLLSLVKILCDIDIAQRNIVQEGHFTAKAPTSKKDKNAPERRVDYRISFAPAMFGQKLVIRVLDESNSPLHVNDLHMPDRAKEIIHKTAEQESGMIMVCGPTGSGKTTTLYAVLRDIDVSQRNVVTIEDPVEIQLEGVTQIPVNEAQGNTFSALLRSVLRQDPDAILIGEIRDAETARIGVQAGMTGHLVFSTIHSRDSIGGIFRLLDLGVEPYVLASGLHLVLAQRLVRQLCTHCKIAKAPTPQQLKRLAEFGFDKVTKVYEPKGCKRCLGTGHLGRRGIFELLSTTPALREVILKSPTVKDIQASLDPEHYIRLQESGFQLVAEGRASFDEIEKAVS
jgi:general secretion pathway protein E